MDPSRVARISVSAMLRGKAYVVPGVMNKMIVPMGRILCPRLNRAMWGGIIILCCSDPSDNQITSTKGKLMTTILRLCALIMVAFVTACATPQTPVVVSFIDTKTPTKTAAAELARIDAFGGSYAAAPLLNLGALHNPATPNGTTSFGDRLITFSTFETLSDQFKFIAATSKATTITAQYVAKPMDRFPMLSDIAPLSNVDQSTEPAFTLVNGIKVQSLLNPAAPIHMARYMSQNAPEIEKRGVKIISPLRITTMSKGDLKLDLIFLTLWPDQVTFDQLHENENFINLAAFARNRAFKSFTDDKARVVQTTEPAFI